MSKLLAISDLYKNLSNETVIIISIALVLFSGFIVSRLTKLCKLPNVTGYIIAGILIGPYVIGLIPENIVSGMSFISDIALALISFSVGKFFKKSVLKRTGAKVIVITLFESLLSGVLVLFSTKYIFNLSWEFAIILGAIATATAPASTMMTINQYRAKGDYVDTLLQTIALDNVVCLILFNVASTIINTKASGNFSAAGVILPAVYNIAVILIGFVFGLILGKMLGKRGQNNRLIIVISMIIGLTGICGAFDISPLLACMVFGATYINVTKDKDIFHQLNNFTPPIMCMFFVTSGMSLNLSALLHVGLIGIVYFVLRLIGKYVGAYLGCAITKKEKNIKNYIGLALIPQAGVAIGLAFLAQRILPSEIGDSLLTIILASSILYELVGPVCAKGSLFLSGTIKKNVKQISDPIDLNLSQEVVAEPITDLENKSIEKEVVMQSNCESIKKQEIALEKQETKLENFEENLEFKKTKLKIKEEKLEKKKEELELVKSDLNKLKSDLTKKENILEKNEQELNKKQESLENESQNKK